MLELSMPWLGPSLFVVKIALSPENSTSVVKV